MGTCSRCIWHVPGTSDKFAGAQTTPSIIRSKENEHLRDHVMLTWIFLGDITVSRESITTVRMCDLVYTIPNQYEVA